MYCRQRRHFLLWWSNLEILFSPLHRSFPFIGGLRCQAIETEHGPYIAERTPKSSLYCEMSMVAICVWDKQQHQCQLFIMQYAMHPAMHIQHNILCGYLVHFLSLKNSTSCTAKWIFLLTN
jgi:hypothetical protein